MHTLEKKKVQKEKRVTEQTLEPEVKTTAYYPALEFTVALTNETELSGAEGESRAVAPGELSSEAERESATPPAAHTPIAKR